MVLYLNARRQLLAGSVQNVLGTVRSRYGTHPPIGQDDFMINPDEDLPKPARKLLVPPPLDMLGVSELNDYIAQLQAEIARVKTAIAAKDAARAAAAAVFKTPPA
jgi:uncharacterized small protein (DUF1192 family)